VTGLSKLILFEHATTNPNGRYDPWRSKGKGTRLKVYSRDQNTEDRINDFETLDQFSVPNPSFDGLDLFPFSRSPTNHACAQIQRCTALQLAGFRLFF